MRSGTRVSGETNVACGLVHAFGPESTALAALVDDHIAAKSREYLRAAGVEAGKIIRVNADRHGSSFSTDRREC